MFDGDNVTVMHAGSGSLKGINLHGLNLDSQKSISDNRHSPSALQPLALLA